MRAVLTPQQAKQQDAWWIDTCGVPSLRLMERAAAFVADAAARYCKGDTPVIAVCGRGNNAGDGYLAAALLRERGLNVSAVSLYERDMLTVDAMAAYDRAVSAGVQIRLDMIPLSGAVVIDAIFGVGLSRAVSGAAACAIEAINASGSPVVSVDLPSGLDGGSGSIMGACVQATETVTFQHEKTGMLLSHGLSACGTVSVCRITDVDASIPDAAVVYEEPDIRLLLPMRARDSHKGKNGRAILFTGSPAYTGAAMLSAAACLRAGAGITTVCAPHAVCEALRRVPEAIPVDTGTPDWDETACRKAVTQITGKTAIGCGSGVGNGNILPLLDAILKADIPAVLDADALNRMAAHPDLLGALSPRIVVTPHPGEMARLINSRTEAVLSDPVGVAREAAAKWGCTVLLKGAGSVITDGTHTVLNTTGNAGLAKGGSGDVLTGIVTALLCQGLSPFDAACAGAYLLGVSAEHAYKILGERMLLASDVVSALNGCISERYPV